VVDTDYDDGGEHLESVRLTARGIPGDRAWAVFDESRDGITNAKRLPLLRACRARFTSEPVAGRVPPAVRITFPDGSTLDSDSPAIADRPIFGSV